MNLVINAEAAKMNMKRSTIAPMIPQNKHSMIVFLLYAETDEDHYHHEDIVNGKGLLHKVSGQVFHSHAVTENFQILCITYGIVIKVRSVAWKIVGVISFQRSCIAHSVYPLSMPENQSVEQQCYGNPYHCPNGCFFNADNVIFFVEDSYV
jgi:hypothetical protein